ncbi:hypothetical protein SAMN05216410_0265 [Sanguibacter gelidistatuariae]|uniref:Uncharacterized protein n=1 Tax=Sanguibacter gelidistatuariae TaxID=1814289 RepID=A0A1G6Y3G3_9MICO|nr:hypothetical protein [Sanguibacter gelidistatuariae]SDD84938.1 hypothetical protein SAMN05216410_0265 [Sanguibacter gelidistatuariae]
MSEHENRWPGPGPSGDAAQETQPAPDLADAGTASEGRLSPADNPPATGTEVGDIAPVLPLGSPMLTPPLVPSRSAARSANGRRFTASPVLIWSVVAAVVLVAAAVTAFLLLRGDDSATGTAPTPVPTVTHTLPAPTATTDPIARGDGTVLFAALPGTVRQYVLTAITPGDLAAQVGALETYDLTYAGAIDGAGDADAVYTVQVTLWGTSDAATAAAGALSAPLAPASSTGDVHVTGAVTGAFSLFGEGDSVTETAHAVWTNGTLVLHASGPAADIRNFYLAYSL